jgi:hypothetical protein
LGGIYPPNPTQHFASQLKLLLSPKAEKIYVVGCPAIVLQYPFREKI